MEAFHYRYHPLARQMQQIAAAELGELRHVEAALCFPLPRFSDIRYRFDLAGGATMDAGCYAINCIRMLGQGEPKVTSARAKLRGPDVDRAMVADFRFPGGATGRIRASLWSAQPLRISAKAVGDRGEMRVLNYLAPQAFSLLRTRTSQTARWERVRDHTPTYVYQLRAFAAAVLRGEPVITNAEDAVANMLQIDSVYRAAGLPPRGKQG
jgi:predicted dehydrogenase